MRGAWSPTTTHSITNTTQTHLDPPLFGPTSRQHERGSSTESPPIKKPSSFFVARRSWGVQTSTVATKARGESWNVGARMEVAMLQCCRLGTVQWELRLASHEYTLLIIKEDVGGPPWDLDSHVLASGEGARGEGGSSPSLLPQSTPYNTANAPCPRSQEQSNQGTRNRRWRTSPNMVVDSVFPILQAH